MKTAARLAGFLLFLVTLALTLAINDKDRP